MSRWRPQLNPDKSKQISLSIELKVFILDLIWNKYISNKLFGKTNIAC